MDLILFMVPFRAMSLVEDRTVFDLGGDEEEPGRAGSGGATGAS